MLRSFACTVLSIALGGIALAPRAGQAEALSAFDRHGALTIALCDETAEASAALSPPVIEIPEGNAAWIYRTRDLEPQREAAPPLHWF